eukprot:1667717-Amphidinium_carterae.3
MTTNVTAWSSGRRQFEHLSESIDVACIQEHHVRAQTWPDVEHSMRGLGYKMSGHPADPGVGSGSHGGVAVAVRQFIGLTPDVHVPTGYLSSRLSSVRIGGIIKGGLQVLSIYLKAGIPLLQQLPYLHDLANYIRALSVPWICLGDYNCTPSELQST